MMNRKQAISKMKKAFEAGELGFQKGAKSCKYYDKKTDSHCAIGLLIGKKEKLMDVHGDINSPFVLGDSGSIENSMDILKMETYCGLTKDELGTLQSRHDVTVNHLTRDRIERFKSYLYNLK